MKLQLINKSDTEAQLWAWAKTLCPSTRLNGQDRNQIQLVFWSGLRTSELIALRWQDVDLEHNRIFVRHAKVRDHVKGTKTSAGSREVTLQPQAKEALLNQHTHTGKICEIVFHDSRTEQPWINDQAIRKAVWTPALKNARINYRNPLSNPAYLCFDAIIKRRKPALGRSADGPQRLGANQKGLRTMDSARKK